MTRDEAIAKLYDLLADMHDDSEDCRFSGGEGCLACMAFDLLAAVEGATT